jgi:hypothetical protein
VTGIFCQEQKGRDAAHSLCRLIALALRSLQDVCWCHFAPQVAPVTAQHIFKLVTLGAYNGNHIFRVDKGCAQGINPGQLGAPHATLSSGRDASAHTPCLKTCTFRRFVAQVAEVTSGRSLALDAAQKVCF